MNCPNCAAPMSFVEDRNYFVCEHCTTFQFSQPDQDGVQTLDERAPVNCLKCSSVLVAAAVDGRKVLHCESCKGLLMPNETFGNLVRWRRGRYSGSADQPIPFNPEELERQVSCPVCQRRMDTHPYYGPGPVVIDTCPDCTLIWLDHGELAKIEKAPGLR